MSWRQCHIQAPYHIKRRHFSNEPLLVVHYTLLQYNRSVLGLLKRIAHVETMIQPRKGPDEAN